MRPSFGTPINPLNLIAESINCNPILNKRQVRAIVDGSWLRINSHLKVVDLRLHGGRLRRYDCPRPEAECVVAEADRFLTGVWEAYRPDGT